MRLPLSIVVLLLLCPLPVSSTPWNVDLVEAPSLWDVTSADDHITIAVIDTGLAFNHPGIPNDMLWNNTGEIKDNGIDDDSNGYIDDIHGFNFIDQTNTIVDDSPISHGTHVTGSIISQLGTAPDNTRIMVLKAFDTEGEASYDQVAEAIRYATNNGADIISMSLGGTSGSSSLATAVGYAHANDVIMVAASGNAGRGSVDYPARYTNVVAVGSVNQNGDRSSFSNYGSELDIMAPGELINSTVVPGSGYQSYLRLQSENFLSVPMEYTELLNTSSMRVVNGKNGTSEELNDINMTTALEGTAVLIERNTMTFAQMAQNLQPYNVTAMLVYNSQTGIFGGTLQSDNDIVAISLNQTTGQYLANRAGENITLAVSTSDYYINSGTSMAVPHVSGMVAALLRSGVDPEFVDRYLQYGVTDMSLPGKDQTTGYGLINGSMLAHLIGDSRLPSITEFEIVDRTLDNFYINITVDDDVGIHEIRYNYTINSRVVRRTLPGTALVDGNLIIELDKSSNQSYSVIQFMVEDYVGKSSYYNYTIDYIYESINTQYNQTESVPNDPKGSSNDLLFFNTSAMMISLIAIPVLRKHIDSSD